MRVMESRLENLSTSMPPQTKLLEKPLNEQITDTITRFSKYSNILMNTNAMHIE